MRTFTSAKIISTHGTRKAAEAAMQRLYQVSGSGVTYEVEHTGPRLFVLIRTVIIESEAGPIKEITSGSPIVCRDCGSADWFYTGRSLYNLNYECAGCARKISPVSETGACQ